MISSKRFVRIRSVVPGTSLLPVPFAIAAAVLVLLAVTLTFDAFTSAGRIAVHPWLSVGNLDDARAILGAILGAVSTVLALIFSVTLLVFSLAVSQFGPRLMPYFLRDRTMQVALGLFLGTFLQSLGALVVTGQRGEAAFVPQLTVLTSVLLVFVSFCYLVFYNHRIALAIQTNNVLARIVEDLNGAIGELSQQRVIDTGSVSSPTRDLRSGLLRRPFLCGCRPSRGRQTGPQPRVRSRGPSQEGSSLASANSRLAQRDDALLREAARVEGRVSSRGAS